MPENYPFKLLSCDNHVEHPGTVFLDYVPEKYREMVPPYIPDVPVLWGVLAIWGPKGVPVNILGGQQRPQDVRQGVWDIVNEEITGACGGPEEYLGWMDIDGVTAAVINPGIAIGSAIGMVKGSGDRDAYLAVLQGFNNWLSDFCSEAPDRLLGAACIPQTSIDDAIAELKRVREMPGIRTLSPGAYPNGTSSPTSEDDRFWAETIALDMPVTLHGGISSPIGGLNTMQDAAAWIIGQTETTTGGPFTAAQMILSGVFDRLPDLRFIIAECGAGWLPYMMAEMDHMYGRHRHWAGFELENPPSWYCTSGNLVWNLIGDHVAIKLRDDIGISNLTWASDFPHSNCQFPYAQSRAKELTAPLTDQERYDVLWGNAARFYGLEQ